MRRIFCLFGALQFLGLQLQAELLAPDQEFEEISGVVVRGSYRKVTKIEEVILVDQVGFPDRLEPNLYERKGYWHLLLRDVRGVSAEDAKFVSVALGRTSSIHPLYLDYLEKKFSSSNANRPLMYVTMKGGENLKIKIGSRFVIKKAVLEDGGGGFWYLRGNELIVDNLGKNEEKTGK
jgi:hypothetical protein